MRQPYATVPRDGSWVRLFGKYTKPDGERVRWNAGPFQGLAPVYTENIEGWWQTPERHAFCSEIDEWEPAKAETRTIDNATLPKETIEAARMSVGFSPESGTVFFPDCGRLNLTLAKHLRSFPVDSNNKVDWSNPDKK